MLLFLAGILRLQGAWAVGGSLQELLEGVLASSLKVDLPSLVASASASSLASLARLASTAATAAPGCPEKSASCEMCTRPS